MPIKNDPVTPTSVVESLVLSYSDSLYSWALYSTSENLFGEIAGQPALGDLSKIHRAKKGDLICQELDIAPTNFWQILYRAKLQLRKCLELNWFKPQS